MSARRTGLLIVTILGVAMSLFHLYSGIMGSQTAMYQRSIHLGFALSLTFLVCPAMKGKAKNKVILIYDLVLVILSFIANGYILLYYEEISLTRMGIPNALDVAMGVILLLLVLEAVRRTSAWAIGLIGIVFVIYGLWGHLLGGLWGHRPYSLSRIIHQLYITTDGIYGVILGASANFIFLFILFPAFLRVTKVGDFITDSAFSIFGAFRGGPAKAAVGASCLFGMISGSGAANVAGTGSITIPLMKKVGYRPEFAGAVEATASTGGQIMPPVMGAAAFVMAEILGMSYGEICLHALLPAFLYYLACLFMVDFEALRMGLKGLSRESLPSLTKVLKEGWFLLTPILLLFILLMVLNWSPQRAAFFTIMMTLALSLIKKSTRLTWQKAIAAMEEGAVSASIDVACLCAGAGIIVGVITLTGLGLKFSTILTDLAGNSLPLLLVLTMLASIILGMGLPPVACYVLLAVLVAPALQKMGVLPIAAHLFVFYFGMIALVTPPVAAAAYIGAGIAGADPWKTGWWAFRLAIAGFLVPYIFVYCPQLLLIGSTREIFLATVTSIIGILALSAAVEGQYYWAKLRWIERILLLGSGIMLIKPGIYTDLFGLLILGGITLKQFYGSKRYR